ncbi:unnamed protein product [Victoria cruziana]
MTRASAFGFNFQGSEPHFCTDRHRGNLSSMDFADIGRPPGTGLLLVKQEGVDQSSIQTVGCEGKMGRK